MEKGVANSSFGKGTPPGNYAGRRARLQQDCTVKLFPPIPQLQAPSSAAPKERVAADRDSSPPVSTRCVDQSCCCNCSCKRAKKKNNKRWRCDSRMLGSATSSCSRSSSLSSWSSCSSRSSRSSNCSSLGGRETLSPLRALSRSMDTKELLKKIAEELASDMPVPTEHVQRMNGVTDGDSRGDPHAPPPSRVLTGAHFLDWYIPQHVAGSRALQRSAKSAVGNRTEVASPMHKPEKQAWVTQIIDPKKTSLPLPTAPKPPVLEHPCPRADNLWEAFSKMQINTNPTLYASHLANSNYLSSSFPPPNFSAIKPRQSALALKSLQLKHSGQWNSALEGGRTIEGDNLTGSMFTKSQVPNKTWFVVHPDWRLEPRPGERM